MIASDGLGERGIVKFMATQLRRKGKCAPVSQNSVTESELAFGEACCMWQERRHRVSLAVLIGQIAAEHHEAAALAIDQCAACRCLAETVEKMRVACKS